MEANVRTANDEAIEAWNGVLFDRFKQYREILVTGLAAHGTAAMGKHPPREGGRVLDIGCGFGDSTCELAAIVGPEGAALGVDAAPNFIEAAREEAEKAGVANVRFEVADLEATRFEERFDYAFARFGTMFFANPVAAMRNVREALEPGGTLCMVVWRQKPDNEWMFHAEQVTERYLDHNEDSDEPTCGPGPFSMANADTTSGILKSAGFTDIALERCDLPFCFGRDLAEGVEILMMIGPAGEVIRLAGDAADEIRPQLTADLMEQLARFETGDGTCWSPSSTWIVTATAPA